MNICKRFSVKPAAARLLAGLLLFGVSGCQTTTEPVTGRRQFILTSPATEARMSLDAWSETLKKEKPSRDPMKVAAVERVGKAISAAINRPDFQWEFRCFESDSANAFCLPGGKVGVYDGLFKYCANDGELAAVVGHEIGHATARHGGERMTQAMVANLGALGLSVALSDAASENRERWLAAYGGVTTIGLILPYSRLHEYAADEIGLIYLAKAGYDPQASLDFWEKFSKDKPPLGLGEFLSTHPVGPKRLARLRELMPKAKVEYEIAPVRRGFGQSYVAPAAKPPPAKRRGR